MQPTIYYCYDAYCGWCYGFSPVIKQIARAYNEKIFFEVLSGGMIPAENPQPISVTAGYISKAYKTVRLSSCVAGSVKPLIFHSEQQLDNCLRRCTAAAQHRCCCRQQAEYGQHDLQV